ncbi:hypothetical protein [Ochrobactrum sp. S1502_03]|uniref:hypothetical protein n=1 Tax=Ochrobactrum sp. S1502_03 TaxID=3108451 RepID=UPI0037C7C2B7
MANEEEFKKLEDAWYEAEGKISTLEAENAALTARVKELEEERACLKTEKHADVEYAGHLETQLAAARKALEFYSNLDNWKNGRFEQVEGGTVLRHHPSSAHKDRGTIARAALEGQP